MSAAPQPAAPTHLPWKVVDEGLTISIDAADGSTIATLGGHPSTHRQDLFDARHIVHCVNQHEKLMEALREARNDLHTRRMEALEDQLTNAEAKRDADQYVSGYDVLLRECSAQPKESAQ